MRITSGIKAVWEQGRAFVHESARGAPAEAARHRAFFALKSLPGLTALAAAPFYLAFAGMPGAGAATAFACLAAPLGASVFLSRTGRLAAAQAIAIAAQTGLFASLGLSGTLSPGVALAGLMIAPLETALIFAPKLAPAAGLASLAAAALVFFAAPGGMAHSPATEIFAAALIGAYGAGLAGAAGWLSRAGARREAELGDKYSLLTEAVGDFVLQLDAGGAVTGVSGGARAPLPLAGRELMGRGLFERIHVCDRPAFLRAVSEADMSQALQSASFRMRCGETASPHGDFNEPVFVTFDMRARAATAKRRGAPVIAILRDVSALRRHEDELEAARAQAERASAWKDRFLANVSHELRTPLNAIIGFSEMLGSAEYAPKDVEKQREYARIIHASGEHLLSVVNTILDMSKIEAGSFEIEAEPFEIAPLVDICCDMVRLKAEQGGITLSREISLGLSELIADKRACKQILINLLSNAVKFTPAGGHVALNVQPEGNSVLLSVADTGIGILGADLGRLGDPFFQARATYDRPYEGTGLGLSVVRGLVGLHGGSIRVESAPGEGTRVVIRLPLDCRGAKGAQRPGAKIETLARRARTAPAAPPRADRITKDHGVKKLA